MATMRAARYIRAVNIGIAPGASEALRKRMGLQYSKIGVAVTRGLNDTAFEMRRRERLELPRIFDRPSPWTIRGINVRKATPEKQVAVFYVQLSQARYLLKQEKGGISYPRRGRRIMVPTEEAEPQTNELGSLGKGGVQKLKQLAGARYVTLASGLNAMVRQNALGLTVLAVFLRFVRYKPRYKFIERNTVLARKLTLPAVRARINRALSNP